MKYIPLKNPPPENLPPSLFLREEVYQSNLFLQAKKKFDLMGMRLFLIALSGLNPHFSKNDKYYDERFTRMVIPTYKLTELLGSSRYLSFLPKTCLKLELATVQLTEDSSSEMHHLFDEMKYKPREGLCVRFNDKLRPYILDLFRAREGYTKLNVRYLLSLSSLYAVRLLELLLQYQNIRHYKAQMEIERRFTYDQLRFMLNVPDWAYKNRPDNFRKHVIDIPLEEINKHTPYILRYKLLKRDKKTVAFKFLLSTHQVPVTLPKSPPLFSNTAIKYLQELGFNISSARAIFLKCKNVSDCFTRAQRAQVIANFQKKPIKNRLGFLRRAIEQDWHIDLMRAANEYKETFQEEPKHYVPYFLEDSEPPKSKPKDNGRPKYLDKELSDAIAQKKFFEPVDDNDTPDVVDTFDSVDDSDVVDDSDRVDTFDSVDDSDVIDTSDRVDTFDSVDDSDVIDTSDRVDTFDNVDDSDTIDVSSTVENVPHDEKEYNSTTDESSTFTDDDYYRSSPKKKYNLSDYEDTHPDEAYMRRIEREYGITPSGRSDRSDSSSRRVGTFIMVGDLIKEYMPEATRKRIEEYKAKQAAKRAAIESSSTNSSSNTEQTGAAGRAKTEQTNENNSSNITDSLQELQSKLDSINNSSQSKLEKAMSVLGEIMPQLGTLKKQLKEEEEKLDREFQEDSHSYEEESIVPTPATPPKNTKSDEPKKNFHVDIPWHMLTPPPGWEETEPQSQAQKTLKRSIKEIIELYKTANELNEDPESILIRTQNQVKLPGFKVRYDSSRGIEVFTLNNKTFSRQLLYSLLEMRDVPVFWRAKLEIFAEQYNVTYVEIMRIYIKVFGSLPPKGVYHPKKEDDCTNIYTGEELKLPPTPDADKK